MAGGIFSPRIDRDHVPVCVRGPESNDDAAGEAAWLARLTADQGLADHDVVLLTGNGSDPAIRLSYRHLVAHPRVVSCGFDVWVACEAGGWAIEFLRFGDGWWWGRAILSPSDRAAGRGPAG